MMVGGGVKTRMIKKQRTFEKAKTEDDHEIEDEPVTLPDPRTRRTSVFRAMTFFSGISPKKQEAQEELKLKKLTIVRTDTSNKRKLINELVKFKDRMQVNQSGIPQSNLSLDRHQR